ncbi:hypothetical protein E4U42_007934 [Claviceps africana]|uniref:CCCH zinc finger and RRM domain-containing protein n=1 Tax=Claviceps africana TaxID=83212 RepID=A0A8K0NFW2_9HYPO|nr:hypothetical protein E4U42_007934 [Claviceps africana]
MLFSEEDATLLKAWIVKRTANTSDADPDVFAEYVIALLKHDGDKASVRLLCEQEIPDFLREDPKQFLDDLFQAITYRSYIPGAPLPPPTMTPYAPTVAATIAEDSKKRTFDDTVAPNEYETYMTYGGRAAKQARRGRRGGYADERLGYGYGYGHGHGHGHGHGQVQSQVHGQTPAQQYPMGFMMPAFDPNNPMDALMSMQAMGMAFPVMGETSGWYGAGARGGRGGGSQRRRCRDFDAKGYCSRGSTCIFDHRGAEETPNPNEYDPSNAMILPFPSSELDPYAGRGRGGRRGGRQRGGIKGPTRAAFSAEGPVTDKSRTAIVVENIPEDDFSEDKIRGFFSQYGDILEISMQPYKHLAIVRFHSWSSANAAYRSPKVIFDNRFVKVFWYKDETDKSNVPTSSSAAVNGAGHHGQHGVGVGPDGMSTAMTLDLGIDLQEFQRKQLEAQKLHQQREEKKTELQRQRERLERQQQELLAKHQAETERLRAKLAEKNGGLDQAQSAAGSSSSADLLRAKLAALEQEAKMLGIDPGAGAAADHASGYRGRAGFHVRGAYRGRGAAAAPRGRGAFFPGHAGRHAAYAHFSIDNRPKKLALTGVDFTPPERDEQLRHFLLNMGEFESVDTSPTVTHVAFRDRKTAEKFHAALHGREFPGVQGTLELSWISDAAGAPGHAHAHAPFDAKTGGEEGGPAGDAMAGMDEEGEDVEAEREESRPVNMDYEAEGW